MSGWEELGDAMGVVFGAMARSTGPDDPFDTLFDGPERHRHRHQPQHRHRRDCRDITGGCHGLHCAACGKVIPTRGPACGECGHVWRTRWGLLLAHWRAHWRLVWRDWRDPVGLPLQGVVDAARTPFIPDWPPVRWWHLFGVFRCWRPGLVWVCPCCSHGL